MPELESKTIALGQLFSQEFFFRVPEYQRPFRWDDDNLTDLINDLRDAPRDREYFLGTLVLHRRDGGTYDLVDGQQRLTALCLLLACIRDAPSLSGDSGFRAEIHAKILQPAKELDGVPERNRVEVRDQKIFNLLVATIGGTATVTASADGKSPSEKRYIEARDIFSSTLSALNESELRELASFVSRKCVLIYLATGSFDDAFRLFTIVNDRGEQLRRIDILKAVNLSPGVVVNDTSRSRYAQEWEAMENRLGETRFEEVFHLLRLIYVQAKPQADLHKEFVTRVFGKREMPKPGASFLDSLSRYVELYDSIFVARDFLESTVDDARFRTLMAAMTTHFGASEWKACLLLYAERYGAEGFLCYVLAIEKLYLEHWVEGVRKDERYQSYTDLLATMTSNSKPADAIDAVTFDEEKIRDACRRKNFYGAGFSKYLLLRAEILASELDHEKPFVVRSIEHVLPQNPGAESQWLRDYTVEEIEELVHTAGNLVLLSRAKNSSASNKDFDDKKGAYLKKRVSDFPRSIQVLDVEFWTKDVIEERTESFASSILDAP